MLLVDREVAGGVLLPGLLALDLLAAHQLGNDAVDPVVLVGGLLARAGDDERRAGFVDQDRVDLVNDGVVEVALNTIAQAELHVVAEVVETELVVGAVGDVAGVSGTPLDVAQIVDDDADGQAEEAVELAHPLGVALGQVVVDGDDVDAAASETIQVDGQRGHQRLTFTGLHFGDLAAVEDGATDELNIIVTHAEHPAAGFADDSEGLNHQVVEGGPLRQLFLKLRCLGSQLGVGQVG